MKIAITEPSVVLVIPMDLTKALEMKSLLDRALNCLEPRQWPGWAAEFERTLDNSIAVLLEHAK